MRKTISKLEPGGVPEMRISGRKPGTQAGEAAQIRKRTGQPNGAASRSFPVDELLRLTCQSANERALYRGIKSPDDSGRPNKAIRKVVPIESGSL